MRCTSCQDGLDAATAFIVLVEMCMGGKMDEGDKVGEWIWAFATKRAPLLKTKRLNLNCDPGTSLTSVE
jgi:hypothetical protein